MIKIALLFFVLVYAFFPLFFPQCLNRFYYVINIPFIFIGYPFGSLLFDSESSSIPIRYQVYSDVLMIAYIILILALTIYKVGTVDFLSFRPLNSFSISKSSIILFIICSVFLLPLWLITPLDKTGLYSFFFDPASHLLLRDNTLKLASKSLPLSLYKLGNFLVPLCVLFATIWFNSSKNYNRIIALSIAIIVILLGNIQGGRSDFALPLVLTFYALFLSNYKFIRTKLTSSLYSFRDKLRLTTNLIKSLSVISLLVLLVFTVIVVLTQQRMGGGGDTLLRAMNGVFSRMFVNKYATSAAVLWSFDELGLSNNILSYVGGFPMSNIVSGNKISLFLLAGKFYTGNLTNLNTSGLFVNSAFFGYLGPAIFLFYQYINYICARIFTTITVKRPTFNLSFHSLSPLFASMALAQLSFNIANSIIGIFPTFWILSLFTLFMLASFSSFAIVRS